MEQKLTCLQQKQLLVHKKWIKAQHFYVLIKTMQPPVIFWEKSCGLTRRMTMLSGDNNDNAKWW